MYSSTPQGLRSPPPAAGAVTPRNPAVPGSAAGRLHEEALESAGRLVDQHLKDDASFVELSGQLRIATHAQTNISGHADIDYPSLATTLPALSGISSIVPLKHTPLPPELLKEFENLQCNCGMGLMPEISRAWLTIDNTLYMWNYVDGKDLAYFDGLNEVVISVGLVLPKPGVFQEHIKFLLCLTTAVEIAILGVSFSGTMTDAFAEMHLQPEPLFHLPSDNVGMMCVEGTPEGRILLGGKDGSLYEITYQAKEGWFSKRCQLVNQSVSSLAFLVPSFLSFTDEDPLMQLVVDSSRQILYTRSNSNTITVYDLGMNGRGLSKVASMGMEQMAQRAAYALQTTDRSLFKPVVSVSVIPCSESSTLHLLAVSQAGVRFYFTTTPNGIEARPSLLALVHVRLPPGFSPSSAANRPGNTVHQAFYRRGSLLLSASVSPDKDTLWLIDSDMFPFQSSLIESFVKLPLEGRMWAMAESIEAGELEAVSSPKPLPPAVVTQHAHPSRQFILVSTQGSYLIRKQRPVEQLRGLLEAGKGGCSEAVRAFFKLHRETQACAMCLILATGSNQQVSQWATEAFFKFGGEPQMALPTTMGFGGQQQQVGGASPMLPAPGSMGIHGQFHSTPQMASTPQQYGTGTPQQQSQTPNFGMTLGRAVVGPEVQLSGKHNGMCRYLARLLRPLWNERIVVSQLPSRSQPEEQFQSRYSFEELTIFLEQICNFKAFFERNPQLLTPPLERSYTDSPSGRSAHLLRHTGVAVDSPLPSQHKHRCEAQEFDSTRYLYQLVVRCYECISLWKLICEYHIHPTVTGLTKDMRERLKLTTFQFLVLSGKELTSALITSLLTRYASDVGMSDTLSARLRETTPSLFSQNDAVMNKASELVTLASAAKSRNEQWGLLRESLKLYCGVSLQLDLRTVCSRYQSLQYLEGVVELCLSSAKQHDPQNLGLHYYKSGQPSDDSGGKKAYIDREMCYSCITAALNDLLALDRAPTSPYPLPSRPGPPTPQDTEDQDSPRKRFDAMVSLALHSKDELFHVHLYNWFRSVDLADRLVEIKTPYIEDYLKYATATQQDNRLFLDLLWRYYEKNNNYAAAARILDQLAHREGPELTLDNRIEYISRAVMCAKSCNLPTTASQEGEFLHELEEKMEVARIQLSILDVLQLLPRTPDIATALNQLNSDLMDITHLYEHFAERFNLAECKLSIVHCAGHYDPTLIESLWRDIIDNELRLSASSSVRAQFDNVRSKLVALGSIYSKSERFFPIEYLALTLEQRACERGWNESDIHRLLAEMGVPTTKLLIIYDKMFKQKDPFWLSHGAPLHVLECIHSLLMDYIQIPSSVSIHEQPSFTTRALDFISQYLIELQTLPPSTNARAEMLGSLRDVQSTLQKMALTL